MRLTLLVVIDSDIKQLPIPFFLLTIIDDGPLPPEAATGFEDTLLTIRGDEAIALAHLKILSVTESTDESPTDTLLHASRHIIIHLGETTLHHHTLFLSKHGAMFIAMLRIEGIYRCLHHKIRICILSHQPTKALLAKRTTIDKTYQVMVGLLTKNLFLLLCS